ncbi:MAG: YebC/PmpR family DNA-binding transcriptional regulator [Actinomycetota bacterium]|nr:YebC/PmpR family DNA-binding transcriptional regulator [Actinomycetota bacterium]
MSGHSKWATIKHKKAAIDKVRGKTFAKLSRLLEVAAREGGGDPATNASLRTVVAKAKAASMTNDAIDRAIKRGIGETDGKSYESVTYEAYGPGGVAMLIEILTDNRNRTAADVRMIFSKQGGSMAAPGSVAWQFSRKGLLLVPKSTSEDLLMTVGLEHGLEDVSPDDEMWQVTTDPSQVFDLKTALESAGVTVASASTTMLSSNMVAVTDAAEAKAILRIMGELDDNDDVQDVFANFDIAESLMQEVG